MSAIEQFSMLADATQLGSESTYWHFDNNISAMNFPQVSVTNYDWFSYDRFNYDWLIYRYHWLCRNASCLKNSCYDKSWRILFRNSEYTCNGVNWMANCEKAVCRVTAFLPPNAQLASWGTAECSGAKADNRCGRISDAFPWITR